MKSTKFCHVADDGTKRTWHLGKIWQLAAALPVRNVRIEEIAAFDEVTWFSADEKLFPTCRSVAQHAKRILHADFEHPIILSAEGWVMDGMHRICKAYLDGRETVPAVQFERNPEPDEVTR